MDTHSDENQTAESGNDSDVERKEKDSEGNEAFSQMPYMTALVKRQYLQEMVKNLPEPVQNRIITLKNLQLEHLKLEAQFFEEVYLLEKRFQTLYQPLFEKRRQIVVGEVEPEKTEQNWKKTEEEVDDRIKDDLSSVMTEFKKLPPNVKGVPNFWYTIFQNCDMLNEMIQPHDEPLLKKLQDITIIYNGSNGYTLEFHFDKNEYFTDRVLTKEYFLKTEVDEEYPFGFEGPEIYKCKGCVINWEKKMNLTVKTIRKTQKHKERGAVRTIVKQVPNDSFFNFFNPPELKPGVEDEESQTILATDYEIGHFLRARIIPKAVLYYTGDIVDDEDEADDECDIEEEEEEDGDKKKKPNECPNQ